MMSNISMKERTFSMIPCCTQRRPTRQKRLQETKLRVESLVLFLTKHSLFQLLELIEYQECRQKLETLIKSIR